MRRTILAALLTWPVLCLAGDVKPVELPAAKTDGGKPLMQALKERRSSREFSTAKLSPQTLSNLLWAAAGVNRADGRRTAPSAMNRQEVDIYVATADGLYLFDAKAHRLEAMLGDDIRAATGSQDFVREAAVNLIYVADLAKMGQTPADEKPVWAAISAGAMVQNVYLYCASEGLGAVVRALMDRAALAKQMKLRPDQRIIVAQTVGQPR